MAALVSSRWMALSRRSSHYHPIATSISRNYAIITRGKEPETDKNLKPYSVNKLRAWDSKWAVPSRSKRFGKQKSAQLVMDDLFLTKFIRGTFPMNDEYPIILGRKENTINVTLPIMMDPVPLNFLVGFSETVLSEWLGCKVNIRPCCVLPRKATHNPPH